MEANIRRIACPLCGAALGMPKSFTGTHIRCGSCHKRFATPRSDDTVAGWMADFDDEDLAVDRYAPKNIKPAPVKKAIETKSVEKKKNVDEKPVVGDIRVVRAERDGVLFEFPSDRMLERSFRLAMPRLCIRCGIKNNLEARAIIFGQELMDCASLEADRAEIANIIIKERNLENVPGEDLLKMFDSVPNIPHPADLAMPYWVCDMCSPVKMILAQAQINSETGEGRCRLQIARVKLAEAFLVEAGGNETDGHNSVRKLLAEFRETPWGNIQEVIQNRIQQWFKPKEGENFLAYVPDRTRMRTEDGMAGIVISDQRFLYHTSVRNSESSVIQPLEMELSMSGAKGNLRINCGGREMGIAVDRQGVSTLRRALIAGKFKVAWI